MLVEVMFVIYAVRQKIIIDLSSKILAKITTFGMSNYTLSSRILLVFYLG